MATQTAEEEQIFASDRAQEASMDHQEAHIRRQHTAINELTRVINFRKARAAEHDDSYFLTLQVIAGITDAVDLLDGILGFIAMLFTIWVPWVYTALFFFGPRNYVWKDTEGVIIMVVHNAFKLIPFVRALPAHSAVVARKWATSIIHKDADLAYAELCEIELALLLRLKKGGRGKK